MPPQKNAGNRSAKKESGICAKNRRFKADFLDDLRKEGNVKDVHIARVLRKMGDGRMEVFYTKKSEKSKETRGKVDQAVIRGSFRGRGKRSVWIDVGSFVAVAETGLGGSIGLEIVAVFSPEEMRDISKEFNVDPRVLAVDATDGTQLLASKMSMNHEVGYEFDTIDEEEEVDIDDI
jgi:hypothetical protein